MSATDSKACTRCGVTKPLGDFYAHATIPGRKAPRCKKCQREATMESRAKKLDEHLARQREKQRNLSPEVRQRRREQKVSWLAEHPERHAASQILNLALRKGHITPQPCWFCGRDAEAHHPDYSRPLDVVWLCASHHREAHALVQKPGRKPQAPIR